MLNPYTILKALLPSRPLQIGTVVAYDNGLATVELPGGGTINARGITATGQLVFVRDDVIEGPAPALTVELIDV
jgi:hypothetical protein